MTASTTGTNKQRPHIAIIMRVTTTLRWAMGRSCNMTFSLRVIPSCFNVAFAIIVLVTFRLAISNWARTKATLMVTLIRDATAMPIPNMFICIYNHNTPLYKLPRCTSKLYIKPLDDIAFQMVKQLFTWCHTLVCLQCAVTGTPSCSISLGTVCAVFCSVTSTAYSIYRWKYSKFSAVIKIHIFDTFGIYH